MHLLTDIIRADGEYTQLREAVKENLKTTVKPLPLLVNGLCDGASEACIISLIEDIQRHTKGTSAAALIVARAIESVTREQMRIKWVNDVYNGRGKVAGILTEALTVGEESAIIVGVGINIGEDDFPEEISQIASSIGEVSDGQVKEIIDLIANGILAHAKDPLDLGFMDEYRKRSMLDGKHVELFSAGESIGLGTVRGISDDGGLILLFDGEIEPRIIRTGEVSVREK